jgi:5-(carboxyamino)imidazole ribonucleotide synthase
VKIVLPGAAIGLLGGGENARMFAFAARRMGYRVHLYSPDGDDAARPVCDVGMQRDFDDLISVRQFASAVDVVTVVGDGLPAATLEAAADVALMRPSPAAVAAASESEKDNSPATAGTPAAAAEFSVIGARGVRGICVFYPAVAIDSIDGEIDTARFPAPVSAGVVRQAVAVVTGFLESNDFVGVACTEFRVTGDNEPLTGKITPHPGRSGHLTIDACVTSQFEQHLRAVCGLPLGSPEMLRPAAMATLPGGIQENGEPDWAAACALSGVKLHLYATSPSTGCASAGHLTATAASSTLAREIVRAARAALRRA